MKERIPKYIAKRRRLEDWCNIRPIPDEVRNTWRRLYRDDYEVYDTEEQETVTIVKGHKKAMKITQEANERGDYYKYERKNSRQGHEVRSKA